MHDISGRPSPLRDAADTADERDGMRILWNVPIEMDDGVVLRADVFLPLEAGEYPTLLTYGPYAKGLAFQEGYPDAWDRMVEDHPEVAANTSSKYANWEVADPEKWIPEGYSVVRVDSRGCGMSEGYVDHFSPRESKDYYDVIEWCAEQSWSTGKVALLGISYYAINQWLVASRNPPHLAAMVPWEGAGDYYRDVTHHGGILCTFMANWYEMQVTGVQYGQSESGGRHPVTGVPISGYEELTPEEREAMRCDLGGDIQAHPLDDQYHRDRSADYSKVDVPFLSAGNWGGQGLHLRGNVEAFVNAASESKWLALHGLEHWTHFYTDYGLDLQRRFLAHFLKGEDNGWDKQPPVLLNVRKVDEFVRRDENEWPLARTEWTREHLDADTNALGPVPEQNASVDFDATDHGVTFVTPPLEEETEVTGPVAAKLFVSSSTVDADIFVVLRAIGEDGEDIVFQGAIDPHTPVGQGWLRASHRSLDAELSTEYRPYHRHDDPSPLEPGEIYELDIEVWPTSIVLPKGCRFALTVRGNDYVYVGPTGGTLSQFRNELTGCGPFLHNDPLDRPDEIFAGTTTVHTGPDFPSYVLLPVIPSE